MKIIFLCGSIEPGRDGVGDYSRRLATELIKQNHQVGILSLNDRHLTEEFDGVQESEGTAIPILRLPSNWDAKKRFKKAGLWINSFKPDWVSLQFVPFAFHDKGLPFWIGKLLVELGNGWRWHIMLHELWVGMDTEASSKFVLWGWLQRQIIKSVFTKIQPQVIHTHAMLYVEMLKKNGFQPQYLPLFGNIPVTSVRIKNSASHLTTKEISFVVFGGIHPGAPIGLLTKELKLYSDSTNTKITLKLLGRCGSDQLRWEREWASVGFEVLAFGEQPTEVVSEVFMNATFGISTTPASLIEKSGSVAAMREHGLPILCISRNWNPRGIGEIPLPQGVEVYKPGNIQDFITKQFNLNKANTISNVSLQFVNNLLSA